ncbi:MAG TPA: TlpA disulfide reductase family protein [Cyclobacteriaceae bacterium]|nr:TlpA disulfide reductase family protein [Cyclobacteriaceae bacterium]
MRTTILLFLLFSNWAFAQAPIPSFEDADFNDYFLNKAKLPVVKGKVLNLAAHEIKKTQIRYSIVTPFDKLQVAKTTTLHSDGTFELTLDYPFPYQQIWLSVGELFYTGIYANADLYIELDARVLKNQKDAAFIADGVKYLSTDGALNTYLNNHILYKREQQLKVDQALQRCRVMYQNYDTYIKKYDSLYNILNELDNEYAQQNPSDFSWVLANERQSAYYGNLCVTYWGKVMPAAVFERVNKHKPYLISNKGMLFYNYLFNYLEIMPMPRHYKVGENASRMVNLLDTLFTPSKSDFLKLRFPSKDPNEKKIAMDTVLVHVKTEWCRRVIQSEYEKLGTKLNSINALLSNSKSFSSGNQLGKPVASLSFGAKLYKVDTIEARMLLYNLKKRFEHKAMLIDVWATWCGPCIEEFPHSKVLRESTKDLPIEFVYICTSEGSDFEKWKTKIAEFELKGTHIYADKKIVHELLGLFSRSGYPTYILTNTIGEFKTTNIRPSSLRKEKLSELIE